ncbi:Cytidyltransferase-like domain-containing protein [Entamoeba marina]
MSATDQILADLKNNFGDGPYNIMIAGVFDLIHPGHLHYIQTASSLGEVTVIIARDSNVSKMKKREAVLDENMRQLIVKSLKGVQTAILGDEEGKWYAPVLKYNPHLFLMGYNQPGGVEAYEKIIHSKGGKTLFRRLPTSETRFQLTSSSQIRKRVVDLSKYNNACTN